MASQSPLTNEPLRLPGQSLDEEIERWQNERVMSYFIAAACLFMLAAMEWVGYLTHSPRHPILFTVIAAVAIGCLVGRVIYVRERLQPLKLGRHGERVVGQFLDGFRARGGRVFHDVLADHFNVDHVVICPQGIYAIETKTWSRPWVSAKVIHRDGKLYKAGFTPDRDPLVQATATADWLSNLLRTTADCSYPVRPVVAIPGWSVDRSLEHGTVCVIEPKDFPDYVAKQRVVLSPEQVRKLAYQLSRYIRGDSEIENDSP
jgi:hypothetical protein